MKIKIVFLVCEYEWLSDCCLTPNEYVIFSYIITRTIYIRWDDNDVR